MYNKTKTMFKDKQLKLEMPWNHTISTRTSTRLPDVLDPSYFYTHLRLAVVNILTNAAPQVSE